VVCPWLLRELVDLGLWDDNMKNLIIAHNGSVQNIPQIPANIKAIYKTVWEISQKKVLDLAADRGAFICQSQSLNVHLQSPTLGQLTSMHFYGWKKGLKTGMYYLRTRPAAQAIQFTVDQSVLQDAKKATADARNAAKSIPTPAPSSSSSPVRGGAASSAAPATPSPAAAQQDQAAIPPTPATPTSLEQRVAELSLDEKARKAAEADPEFAAALQRQRDREAEEEARLSCSLENKEACLMCSG
jgi:ribonucleoside-diphosphate reductase subunit M1